MSQILSRYTYSGSVHYFYLCVQASMSGWVVFTKTNRHLAANHHTTDYKRLAIVLAAFCDSDEF